MTILSVAALGQNEKLFTISFLRSLSISKSQNGVRVYIVVTLRRHFAMILFFHAIFDVEVK